MIWQEQSADRQAVLHFQEMQQKTMEVHLEKRTQKSKKMKRLNRIIIALTCLAACSFTCEDHWFEYEMDENEETCSIVLNDVIAPSFRIIELAEVFTGYQAIRSERERALRYVESFFGTRNFVYYEYMEIYNWGKITLQNDGSFIASPGGWKSHWIALSMDREVHITSDGNSRYTATSTSEKDTWSFAAEITDYNITMTALHAKTENDRYSPSYIAEVELIEPLKMPMCNQGKGKLEPVAGVVQIRYRDSETDKSIQVEFTSGGKVITLEDGTVVQYGSEPIYNSNVY